MSAVLAVPLQKLPFMFTPLPCKLCKCKMEYLGPSVDRVMTYHTYICPVCEALSCAAFNNNQGGPVEWLNFQ